MVINYKQQDLDFYKKQIVDLTTMLKEMVKEEKAEDASYLLEEVKKNLDKISL